MSTEEILNYLEGRYNHTENLLETYLIMGGEKDSQGSWVLGSEIACLKDIIKFIKEGGKEDE